MAEKADKEVKIPCPNCKALACNCYYGLIAPKDGSEPPRTLISFESGHYKTVHGNWKGDSVWTHFIKPNGKAIHINKEKVEYMEEL